jgi:hypothetical protein
MTARERVVERVRKFLSLATSANPHEAASADTAARRLMCDYHVTQEEVEASRGADHYELSLGEADWSTTWRFVLVTAAARRCGAEAMAFAVGGGRRVRLVGKRQDVEQSKVLYDRIAEVLEILRSTLDTDAAAADEAVLLDYHLHTVGSMECLDSWYRGCVRGVVEILHRSVPTSGPVEPTVRDPVPRDPGGQSRPPAPRTIIPGKDLVPTGPVRGGTASGPDRVRRGRPTPLRLGEAASSVWYLLGKSTVLSRLGVTADLQVTLAVEVPTTVLEKFFWE